MEAGNMPFVTYVWTYPNCYMPPQTYYYTPVVPEWQ